MTTLAASPELLDALRAIPGVAGLEVPDEHGSLALDLATDADAAAVAAAAAALLDDQARLDVTGSTLVEQVGAVGTGGRLAVESLDLSSSPGGVQASLVLTLDEHGAPGTASVAGAAEAVAPQAVATAVLLALEELTEDAVIGTVELARVSDVAEVRLRLDVDGTEIVAVGDAAVLGHAPQAVVRAVLAALEPHLPA